MTRPVTVMVLPPGSTSPRLERIDGDNHLELVRLVGGNLGSCGLPKALRDQDFYAFCDDDARIRPDRPEANSFAEHLGHDALYGPVVIVRTDFTGETRTLRPKDVASLELYFYQEAPAEAKRAAAAERVFWEAHPSGTAVWTPDQGWLSI